jgi:hypothetical protein
MGSFTDFTDYSQELCRHFELRRFRYGMGGMMVAANTAEVTMILTVNLAWTREWSTGLTGVNTSIGLRLRGETRLEVSIGISMQK